jgi:NTP pyrophosphatase (non-canonical NTP hydrolase)
VNKLERDIAEFADANLKRDLPSRLKKLGEEFGELAEAIAAGRWNEARLEAADMGIVLTDITHLLPWRGQQPANSDSLSVLMDHKFNIIMKRFAAGNWPKKGDR